MNLIQADARHIPVREDTVQAIITSPPYFGLRKYGEDDREIGLESLEDYLDNLRLVAQEMYKVLRHDGTAWVNLGDTASGSGGAGGDWKSGSREDKLKWKQGETGIPKGQWCLVPQRAALMFQERGWFVRSVITWDKMKVRPEAMDHIKRPYVSNETVLMLTKVKSGYKFYPDAFKRTFAHFEIIGANTWHIESARTPSHGASFPSKLVARCLAASTLPGDLVLDPFVGSGTVLNVARAWDRRAVGLDLYPEYMRF